MGQVRIEKTVLWEIIGFTAVVFSILGFIGAKVVRFGLTYSKDISIADILNIIITSVVTLTAAWYLSKKLSEDRFTKEIAISDLKEIEQNVAEIIHKVQVNDQNLVNDLMMLINHLQQLLLRFDRTCKFERDEQSVNRINNRFLALYGCATNFGDDPIDPQFVIQNGNDLIVEIRDTISNINKL
ncbi:MAG: hypothetical protein K2N34_05005 [Lachnospiraceae bacterium]|nr:hypothetical protein [Lachnospiraceae bacterium]